MWIAAMPATMALRLFTIVTILIIAAIFGPVLAPYDPVAMDFGARFASPSLNNAPLKILRQQCIETTFGELLQLDVAHLSFYI